MKRAFSTYLLTSCVALCMVACTTTAPVKEDLPALDARFRGAYERHAGVEAASALTEIARRSPGLLARYSDPVVAATVFTMLGSSPAEKTARLELLRQLHAQHWKGQYGVEPSEMWALLVRLLVERGRVNEARDVVADIRSARPLLMLSVDKRFRLLMQVSAPTPSVELAAKLEVEDWRQAMLKFPRSLQVTEMFLQAALSAGDYTESLAAANSVLDKVAAAKSPQDVYDDAKSSLNWLHDHRARSLLALGQWQMAEAEMRAAAEPAEDSGRNVSNVINLASYYANLERPDAAMAALGPIAESDARLSKYGVMQVKLIRYEVARLRNDAAAAREPFEFMSQHRADSFDAFQVALLLAGRQDEGAQLLIERLRDPERRADALVDVQIYAEKPHLPLTTVILKRWRELVERSDVSAVIAEVGVVERFAIPEP